MTVRHPEHIEDRHQRQLGVSDQGEVDRESVFVALDEHGARQRGEGNRFAEGGCSVSAGEAAKAAAIGGGVVKRF